MKKIQPYKLLLSGLFSCVPLFSSAQWSLETGLGYSYRAAESDYFSSWDGKVSDQAYFTRYAGLKRTRHLRDYTMLEIGLRFQNWGVQSTRIKYGWIRGNGSGGGAQKPYTEWNTISWTSIGIPIAFLLGYDFPLKFGIQVSPNVVLFRAKTYYKRQDEDPKARFPDIERDRLFYKSDLLDYVNFTAEFKAGYTLEKLNRLELGVCIFFQALEDTGFRNMRPWGIWSTIALPLSKS